MNDTSAPANSAPLSSFVVPGLARDGMVAEIGADGKFSVGIRTSVAYQTIPGTKVPRVEFLSTSLGDLKLDLRTRDSGSHQIEAVTVDGVRLAPSDRLLTSLAGIVGQPLSIFNLFSPDEVLTRAVERGRPEEIQIATVMTQAGVRHALAATRAGNRAVRPEDLVDALADAGVDLNRVGFANGQLDVVRSPVAPSGLTVSGDSLLEQYLLRVPLDGFGSATAWLAVIRAICANLNVYADKTFQMEVKTPKSGSTDGLRRFMNTFSSEEGYGAIQQRLEASAGTLASLNEYYHVVQAVSDACKKGNESVISAPWNEFGLIDDRFSRTDIMDRMSTLAGGGKTISERFGITNLDHLSARKRALIPTYCTVYDLINAITEVGTHLVTEGSRRHLHATTGSLLGRQDGYDLEGVSKPKAGYRSPGFVFLPN